MRSGSLPTAPSVPIIATVRTTATDFPCPDRENFR